MTPDLFSLEGRTALVTGGGRGIGRMIAEGFLAFGAKVYISGRDAAACQAAAAELSSDGGCVALAQDIATADGCRALAAQMAGRETRLDILVNNAGLNLVQPFAELTEDAWDQVIDINLKAPFFLTQALHGLLAAAASPERPAKVINISSIGAVTLNPGELYAYHAAKAGLGQLTRRMAKRLVEDDIMVTAIAPALFASDMNAVLRDNPEQVLATMPAKRVGRAEDMAGAAVYLASRAGDFVCGSTLFVDGGAAYAR